MGTSYHANKHHELASLSAAVIAYAEERVRLAPPLDRPLTEPELRARVGQTITAKGIGGIEAMRLFADDLAPTCLSTDHPRYLSFIPCAPSDAASLFDVVVGASSIYGGSWLEGAGAVYAENLALRWIADLVGLPSEAGGVFTPGGTIGNLSALVAARHTARAAAAPGCAQMCSSQPRARIARSSPRRRSWMRSSPGSRWTAKAGCGGTPCAR